MNSYNLIRSRLVKANAAMVNPIKAQRCEDGEGQNTDYTKGAGLSHQLLRNKEITWQLFSGTSTNPE